MTTSTIFDVRLISSANSQSWQYYEGLQYKRSWRQNKSRVIAARNTQASREHYRVRHACLVAKNYL